MKLHYFHGRGPLRALVMTRRERRVELHIKQVGEGIWALVAMAGPDEHQPERHRCQGPYKSATQAEAALRGVAGSLLETGYEAQSGSHVVWSVTAQRLARGIRRDRDTGEGSSPFDPDPHEPLG
ncbi:MAG: hypothetical protein R3280_09490 [Marinobacter sp.]|uniref:PA4575 family protein n=1 Tax=Marinobacter sp. TaxID=50741 RepID=UPI00299ED6FE|nr:hypothetical protein [Marinobacter sp.]MDX1634858.1 hypothetical protein [Marinobacter sp.]